MTSERICREVLTAEQEEYLKVIEEKYRGKRRSDGIQVGVDDGDRVISEVVQLQKRIGQLMEGKNEAKSQLLQPLMDPEVARLVSELMRKNVELVKERQDCMGMYKLRSRQIAELLEEIGLYKRNEEMFKVFLRSQKTVSVEDIPALNQPEDTLTKETLLWMSKLTNQQITHKEQQKLNTNDMWRGGAGGGENNPLRSSGIASLASGVAPRGQPLVLTQSEVHNRNESTVSLDGGAEELRTIQSQMRKPQAYSQIREDFWLDTKTEMIQQQQQLQQQMNGKPKKNLFELFPVSDLWVSALAKSQTMMTVRRKENDNSERGRGHATETQKSKANNSETIEFQRNTLTPTSQQSWN